MYYLNHWYFAPLLFLWNMFGVHIVSTPRQHAQDVFCFKFDNLLHSAAVSHVCALEGNKLNMLTHIYSHKHMRKIEWPSAITRLTAYFTVA